MAKAVSSAPQASSASQQRELYAEIGSALLAWAACENLLSVVFVRLSGSQSAAIVWDCIRSFDAKAQALNDVATQSPLIEPIKNDWQPLMAHTKKLYGKRNQIAHSSLVLDPKTQQFVVHPFPSITKAATKYLTANDIDAMSKQFLQLVSTLQWLASVVEVRSATRREQLPAREPELVQSLRSEEARKREVQSHRNKAEREYIERNPSLKKTFHPTTTRAE